MKTTLLKALWIVMILCVAAFAATTTTITDTVYRSDGTASSGSATISWPTYTADDGRFVIYGSKRVKFTNGVFTVALEPMPNSATYKVEWEQSVSTTNGTQTQIKTEYWLVPASATPLTISQVRVASLVAPTATFNYRLLAGLTKGDILYGDASGIATRLSAPVNGDYAIRWTNGVPSYVAGGGSWGNITGTLSTQTDLQVALSSKQDLINGAPATWPTFATVATSGAYADLSGKPSIPTTAVDIGAQPAGSYVTTSDARLTDARTPVTHASTHATGQSDEITPWSIGAAASGHAHAGVYEPVDAAIVRKDADGNVAIGTTCPGGAPAGSMCAGGKVYAGGAEVGAGAYTTITYSATPAFTGGTSYLITLTGDVTSSTLTGAVAGQILSFRVCQDGAGSHAFVWPVNVLNAGTVDGTISACTNQVFVYDGTNAVAMAPAYVTGVAGGSVYLPGSTSGGSTIVPPETGGGVATLPAGDGTLAYASSMTTGYFQSQPLSKAGSFGPTVIRQIRTNGFFVDQPVVFGNILISVTTADTTGCAGSPCVYDWGIYSVSGDLVAHVGPRTITATGLVDLAISGGGTATLPRGRYYWVLTGTGTTAKIAYANTSTFLQFASAATASITQCAVDGTLPTTITPPADTWTVIGDYPFFGLR